MNTFRQFCLELGRLLRSRLSWLVILLTVLSPAAGLFLYQPTLTETMQGAYIANPALAGGVLGAVFFALLTIWELDRVERGQVGALIYAAVSPLTVALVRLAALLCVSLAAQLVTVLLWLPYTAYAVGVVFEVGSYLAMYFIFMYGAIPLAILFAVAAWQFTHRFDLSVVLFAAFAGLSLTVWGQDWQLCWLNPLVWAVSDDFSNHRLYWEILYMRLTWLLALAGLWGLSYLCVRRYGKGPFGSLRWNIRRVYRPILSLGLLLCCGFTYVGQPFFDHSPEDFSQFYMQEYNESVTCSGRHATVTPDPATGRVSGTAVYQLQNSSGREQPIQLDFNAGYRLLSAQVNGKDIPYTLGDENQIRSRPLWVTLPGEGELELTLTYEGLPREWNAFDTQLGDPELSDRYMELTGAITAPNPYVLYYDESFAATTDLILPDAMTPVLFGLGGAELLKANGDGTNIWRVTDNDFSTSIYVGDYLREEIHVGETQVDFYYARKHQSIMEQADVTGAIRQVMAYCMEHYGPLPFGNQGGFNLIQTRVYNGGGAKEGASTMSELDFTAQNLAGREKGATPGEVMIHEIVHQWWGLGVMVDPADFASGWSAEGLACYTTYRIVKELYGEQAAQAGYVDQWRQALQTYNDNFYVRHPEYLAVLPEEYQADIANSFFSILQYNEMPLKILKAEQLLGGEEAMDQVLRDLFNKELDPMYPYVTYQDFLDACGLSEEDLTLE